MSQFKEVLENLLNGDWNAKRESTGGLWVEALARATGREIEEALTAWNNASEEQRKAIKANAKVKVAKAEIDAERAQRKADEADGEELEDLF